MMLENGLQCENFMKVPDIVSNDENLSIRIMIYIKQVDSGTERSDAS